MKKANIPMLMTNNTERNSFIPRCSIMNGISLIMSVVIILTLLAMQSPVEAKSPTHRNVILVVEGSSSTYTKEDIAEMKGADGFIILPAGKLTGKNASFQYGYSTYLDGLKATIATVLSVSSSFDIYIGTPWTVGTNLALPSSRQIDSFLSEAKNKLSSVAYQRNGQTKSTDAWNNNVVGFYYSEEWWYGQTTDSNFCYLVDIGNKIHGVIKYYDNYARANMSMNKKFYWIPPYMAENYIGDDGKPNYKISKLLAYQNKYSIKIFDYIVVQPNYYFGNTGSDVFSYIQAWIKDGAVNGTKLGSTKLGMEMEMDSDNGKNKTKTKRYTEYVKAIKTIAKDNKIPMVMYCDGAEAYRSTKNYVIDFLNTDY